MDYARLCISRTAEVISCRFALWDLGLPPGQLSFDKLQLRLRSQNRSRSNPELKAQRRSFVLTLFIFKAPNYVLARTLTERVV